MRCKSISVVIPAFNEEKRIGETLADLTAYFTERMPIDYEIIVVDDGSTDQTGSVIKQYLDEHIHLLTLPVNQGKGGALKEGFWRTRHEAVLFLDADNEISVDQIEYFLKGIGEPEIDGIIGYKQFTKTVNQFPLYRKVCGKIYRCICVLLFGLKYTDTQAGIKCFKSSALKPSLDQSISQGFSFDVELLVNLEWRGYTIIEQPIRVNFVRKGLGKNNLLKFAKAFYELFQIYFHLKGLRRKELLQKKGDTMSL